jgi:hypothetical protein
MIGVLRVLNALISRMYPDVLHKELERTVEALSDYLSVTTLNFDAQYNELDKVLLLVKYYGGFLQALTNTNISVMQPDEITLVYIIQYLGSQTFEKKFSAINLLKAKLEKFKHENDSIKNEWRSILLKNGILNTLYITGYNPEVAKKSDDLMTFLAPLLLPETIETLLTTAYEQSAEKGGVICQCLRKSLGQFKAPVSCANG